MIEPGPVLDAARRRAEALVNKDVDTLLTLLHRNFLYVNASGEVLDREQYLNAYVRSEDVRWTSQVLTEPRLAEGGATVILTGLVHDVARFGDHALDETFRTTLTWVDSGNGWQCLGGNTMHLG
jgi:hypothetical protein